jgi:hypothetical protein
MARVPAPSTATSTPLDLLAVGAGASIGAGAIHAAAIGMHNEHGEAVVTFALLAAFQFGWGVFALTRRSRVAALIGVVGNALAVAGWVVAKTRGIGMIDGLGEAEPVQLADCLAAALAALAIACALLWMVGVSLTYRVPVRGAALLVVALTLTGMIATGGHDHAGGHGGDDHAGDGHAGDGSASGAAHHDTGSGDQADAGVAPKVYDPTKPIDLGGVAGVTPEQQARAENLIAITLARLPQFADPAAAEAAGFHSIGDAATGDEHYINWSYVNDDKVLDPDYPESLVYQPRDGRKELVAAMFMLPDGSTLDTVPDVGGPLTQWHVHNNLCFTEDPVAPTLAFGAGRGPVVGSDDPCPAPTQKRANVPMIHVWIVPHPCGPFAALEGIGGGQIKPGEERLCDHAHGSS